MMSIQMIKRSTKLNGTKVTIIAFCDGVDSQHFKNVAEVNQWCC